MNYNVLEKREQIFLVIIYVWNSICSSNISPWYIELFPQKIYKVSILSKISVIKVLSKKVYTYYFPISLLRVYQWYLTLCNPMDCSLPGSSVHWIFQARILEWVAIPFSGGSSQHRSPGLLPCRQILYHLSHQGSLLFYIFYL